MTTSITPTTSPMTPLMRQYHDIKIRFPDEIVLFQVGDFYELFYDDAQRAAASLGIVLTSRGTNSGQPIPLCGFPRHSVDTYLIKLIQAGFRVVMCDQLAATEGSKLIERTVSQVLTPGTLTDVKLLDEKSASYICAVVATEHAYGLLFVEPLTGKAYATVTATLHKKLLEAELSRFLPNELIIASSADELARFFRSLTYATTTIKTVQQDETRAWLRSMQSAAGELVERSVALMGAVELLHAFLTKNNPFVLQQIKQIEVYKPEDFLILDASTQRNLELVKNQDGTRANSLFSVLDHAITPMGSRTIKKWILRPLANYAQIEQRLFLVQTFVDAVLVREQIIGLLRLVGDLERVVGRIALQRALLPDYLALQSFLAVVPQLQQLLAQLPCRQMHDYLAAHRQACVTLQEQLNGALYAETERPWTIKAGYHEELDRLRALVDSGSHAILELEQQEQQATGIGSLKIRFNNAHGYGIEVTKPHLHLVPERYQRLQILVNRDRFATAQLRDLEYDMRRAQTDSLQIEKELFANVCQEVSGYVPLLQAVAEMLAELDAYIGFARSAVAHQYVRPSMTQGRDLLIKQSRHPVVEEKIKDAGRGQFIANDITLTDAESLWIVTGPNMGGKSTFLRQTALAVVMAQAGSFVPAAWAQIPVFDRIFTRIGAADNVAQGKSTFWVEMEETALICHEATEKSLVILDEVGRGTSTYDGLAIAQAVVEYIYATIKARCLFATHYHELTELVQQHQGIVAYHAASRKTADGIVLLHQIQKGCAQGSFGLEVAKSAQLPAVVIARAQTILADLAAREVSLQHTYSKQSRLFEAAIPAIQISVQEHERYQALRGTFKTLDLDALSPRQAFALMGELKAMIEGEGR